MNSISVDLEDWWCNEYLTPYLQCEDFENLIKNDQIVESVSIVLDLLNKKDVCCTFFILGSTAERHPDLIKEIHAQGHEIASHGYSHKRLDRMSEEEFDTELSKTEKILSSYNIKGFRAPSFSLNQTSKWAIDVLEKREYLYDSSIMPTWTPLHGIPKAPKDPYYINSDNIGSKSDASSIVELPLTVSRTPFLTFPCSGGFFLRSIPEHLLLRELKKINRLRPIIAYIHPWELNENLPKIKTGMFARFESNYGKKGLKRKIEKMIDLIEPVPLIDLYQSYKIEELYDSSD